MVIAIGLIALLTVILIIDFIAMPEGKGFNDFIDRWLLKTLWIWLPFHALIVLTKDMIERSQSKK